MRGNRRLLWSVLVVVSAGCQTIPSGTQTLSGATDADRGAPTKFATATSNRPRALFGSRSSSPAETLKAKSNAASEQLEVSGPWDTDEALRLVLQQEFADATDAERRQWLLSLSQARPEDIPRLLTERRQRLDAEGIASSARDGATDDSLAKAPRSAQQIILTEQNAASASFRQTAMASPDEQSPSGIDWASLRGRKPISPAQQPHPLLTDDSGLSAPRPGSSLMTAENAAAVAPPSAEDSPGFVAKVYDVFGVGGERQAAAMATGSSTAIQPAGMSHPNHAEEAAARMDLEAAKSLQSVYWQADLDKLIALLEAQVSQQQPGDSAIAREHYIRQHVALRMLYLIASRRPEALQTIPDIPQDDQEFWTQMFWALSTTFDNEAMPNSSLRAAETIAQLREAIRQLEPRANIDLQQTVFCQRINGFGDFVAFDIDEFKPGQPVLIYTEVRNFQSEGTPKGDFRTVLRSRIQIRKEEFNGPVVFNEDLSETEDRCQSRRRDYFHSYRIELPPTLEPGPHVLTLDVTDTLTGKTGTTTLNFIVR